MNNTIHQTVADETGKNFYPGYLAAKKTIDDRALNNYVWETLSKNLASTNDYKPITILEIGAGIGTMFERIIERGLLRGPATYVATDSDPNQLRAARKYLSGWAEKRGHALSWDGDGGRLRTASTDVSFVLELAGAEELANKSGFLARFDLLLAHGVLDLIDFPAVLPSLLSRLTKNGLAYLTCNFDGETVFLPECDGDAEIIRHYHASMEARLPGASHTGRRLLTFLQSPDLELLAAGSSDWIIHPRDRQYGADETFFLHTIIETVEAELTAKNRSLPSFASWAAHRHRQVEAGELSFLARHLDLLVQHHPPLP